jgi:hypothetical protein
MIGMARAAWNGKKRKPPSKLRSLCLRRLRQGLLRLLA